jgi:predicted enzyme related to lactoylglutathione lyase
MAARKTAKRPRTTSPLKKRSDRTARTPAARKPAPSRRPRKSVTKLTKVDANTGESKEAPIFKKVAFTMFPVTDSTRARAFYEEVLGLKRGLASPDGVWTEYDLPMGGCLALFKHPMPQMAMKPGGASIAFEVSDLDALNERLTAAGVTYQGPLVHGPHCRMSNILDSEGNHIVLHQLNPR